MEKRSERTIHQLNNLFTYEECVSVITQTPEIIFLYVTVLQNILTEENGTLQKGEKFYEVYFNITSLRMKFMQDFVSVVEIMVKIEKEDR